MKHKVSYYPLVFLFINLSLSFLVFPTSKLAGQASFVTIKAGEPEKVDKEQMARQDKAVEDQITSIKKRKANMEKALQKYQDKISEYTAKNNTTMANKCQIRADMLKIDIRFTDEMILIRERMRGASAEQRAALQQRYKEKEKERRTAIANFRRANANSQARPTGSSEDEYREKPKGEIQGTIK
jgi:hypothetical protein